MVKIALKKVINQKIVCKNAEKHDILPKEGQTCPWKQIECNYLNFLAAIKVDIGSESWKDSTMCPFSNFFSKEGPFHGEKLS